MMTVPSIAIIGAGPAGLTLARLLQVASVSLNVTIYELDDSPKSRKFQGGTLDLHPQTGLAALRQAGLWAAASKWLRYEGEEMVIADYNATQLMHVMSTPKIGVIDDRPEIDREKLKDLLLESVDPKKIKWGMHLRRVDGEKGLLYFGGHGVGVDIQETVEGPFDLIVGADGAWSKVRHVLTDVRPHYSGVCGFEAHIRPDNKQFEEIAAFVGKGSYFAYSGGRSMMAQRMGDKSVKASMFVKQDEEYTLKLKGGKGPIDDAKLKGNLLVEYQDWDSNILKWISAGTDFREWVLWELPVGHTWNHRSGYTLIGDAAHLATPFAGQGVNAAMKDALVLCNLIVESCQDKMTLDEAIQKYEEDMFPRGRQVQEQTMRNKTNAFGPRGPAGWLVGNISGAAEDAGWSLDKGLLRWIPVRRIAYGYLGLVMKFGALKRRIRTMFYGK